MSPPKRRAARPRVIAAALALSVTLASAAAWLAFARPAGLRRAAIDQARKIADKGDRDLALRHLQQYLRTRPDDVEALELQARISGEAAVTPAQWLEAARLHDRVVRLDPDGPGRQATRRRLADLYLKHADSVRSSALSRTAPTVAVRESQYHAAEQVARELLRRGDDDAGAHRLLARALEGLAVPGDDEALRGAMAEFEQALRREPADVDSAARLAELCFGRGKNPGRGDRALDAMLAARPGAGSRLARHRIFEGLGRRERAADELAAAVAEAPLDVDVRLAATSEALRRGDAASARGHLDALPKAAADDPRVRVARGLVDFGDSRPEEAIAGWRRGLIAAGGSDPELTWWLGYALIQLGRVGEAKALVGQYRRLEGDDGEPHHRLLLGLMEQKGGRPARAIRDLEAARDRVAGLWFETAQLALGRAHEDLNDPARALEDYRRAAQAEPGSPPPRLAIAALLLRQGKPDEAAAELRRGLEANPRESRMLLALARALVRVQAGREPRARGFEEADRALSAAAAAAGPRDRADLASIRAEREAAGGDLAAPVEVLAAAAAADPRSAPAWANWAEALAGRGRVAEALDVLGRGAKAAGDRAVIRTSRAAILMGSGRGREARLVLMEHPEAMPPGDRPTAFELAARLAESKGDVGSARASYLAWAAESKDDPRPRLGLLGLALDSGDPAAARAAVDALRNPADPGDVAYRLGRALERLIVAGSAGDEKARAEALREGSEMADAVLADAPELAAASYLKGWALRLKGRPDEAAEAYRRAWERGIDSALAPLVDLLASRGRVDDLAALRQRRPAAGAGPDRLAAGALVRLGRADSADRFLDRVAGGGRGDSPEADLWLARMLDRAGKTDRAEALLKSLAERRPSEPEPWLVLLRYQVEHGRKEAAAATRSTIASKARSDRPWLVSARVLWTSGDAAAAGRAFEAAAAAHPNDVPTLLAAAGFFEGTGRPADAAATLRQALAKEPGNRPAARELSSLLADRAKDDPDAWKAAFEALGPEPTAEAPADVMARCYVLAKSADPARKAEAVSRLEGLIADLPPTEAALGRSARRVLAGLLMESGRFARAAQLSGVSAASGDDPADVALFAEASLKAGNLAEAARQLDLLAMLAPGDPTEAALRARLIRESNPPGEVARAMEKAVEDRKGGPGFAALAREVADQLDALGPAAAASSGRVALRLAASDPSAAWVLGRSMARSGKIPEALDQCRRSAASGGPRDARQAALVALQVARSPNAPADAKAASEAILEAALGRFPDSVPLIELAIVLRHEQARYEDEVRLCRLVLARLPEDVLALNNLACALSEGLKRPAEALPAAEALVRARGRIPAALGTRGLVLTRLNRLDDAIKDLEQATRDLSEPGVGSSTGTSADPASLVRLAYLCRAYSLAGRPDDSRRCRDQARRLGIDLKQVDPAERDELGRLLGL